jgi:hypothetical protein
MSILCFLRLADTGGPESVANCSITVNVRARLGSEQLVVIPGPFTETPGQFDHTGIAVVVLMYCPTVSLETA